MKNIPFTFATTLLLSSLAFSSQALAEPIISTQPISFNKSVSYNDIFVISKVIEYLQKNNVPFFVSNEGTIYVEEINIKSINRNVPTDGLGQIQFPELSSATIYMALLSEKGIDFITSKSGDNKYFNLYYNIKDHDKIIKEVQPLFVEALSFGVLINKK